MIIVNIVAFLLLRREVPSSNLSRNVTILDRHSCAYPRSVFVNMAKVPSAMSGYLLPNLYLFIILDHFLPFCTVFYLPVEHFQVLRLLMGLVEPG